MKEGYLLYAAASKPLKDSRARKAEHGRAGVFWQTQGSGKSFSMVFFAQKVLRKVPGDWTFVVVTDRAELDDQIAKTFKACAAVTEQRARSVTRKAARSCANCSPKITATSSRLSTSSKRPSFAIAPT